MVTKSIACPSCEARLKIAGTLPAGKKIKCPKCENAFAVPDDDEDEVIDAEPVAPARKAKVLPPLDDYDDEDEEEEERPVARRPRSKGKKAKKAGGNGLLIGVIVGAVVLLLGGGGAAAFFLWPAKGKPAQAAQQGSPPSAPQPAGAPSGVTPPAATGGEVASATGGRKVYDDAKCSRCHSIDGGKSRAPDLSRAGASRSAEWLTEHVRNPKSHNPRSTMPGYEGKIPPQDLRALGEFLASLK